MRDFVLIYVNGQRHEIRAPLAFISLSTFLREHLRLIGTKIVCSEGDCGSCTVLLGRPGNGTIAYAPVCSCIQHLLQLDCMHIITVEGLKYDGKLNPIQESMVKCHGAQCGFCTPGFVVSMCSLLDSCPKPTDHDLRRGLVGNLCRCTGYQAILDAGKAVDAAAMRPLAALYDTTAIASDLAAHEGESVTITDGDRSFAKPVTIAEAAAFKQAHPGCTVISGGTDLGVQVNKAGRVLTHVLSTRSLKDLQGIEHKDGMLILGASTSLTELESAATSALPDYGRMLGWFGSPPIKNAGTLGGNIANGSPIADTMPALFVLNGEIELAGVNGTRRVNMNAFFTGYKKNVMTPDELITRVHIPLPRPGELFKVYKVSKRKDLDISTFTAALWLKPSAGMIADIRIAYGGVAPTVVRLPQTEAFLCGKPLSSAVFKDAGAVARSEIRPITDMRGSAEYRLQLAENILCKFAADIIDVRITAGVTTGNGRH